MKVPVQWLPSNMTKKDKGIFMNVKEKDQYYIANTYARFPIEIVSGKGSTVVDSDGKEYIDMGSGIAVNIFGMCDEYFAPFIVPTENERLTRKSVRDILNENNIVKVKPQVLCSNGTAFLEFVKKIKYL